MGARGVTALLLAGGLLVAAPAWSQAVEAFTVRFLDGEDQLIRLKQARVIAYDDDDKPMFEAGLNYILAYAENPKGRVYEWRPHAGRVRVSPDGIEGVWLKCADLKRMSVACGPRLQIDRAVIYVGEGEVPESLLQPPPAPATADNPYGTIGHGSGTGTGSGYAAGPGAGRGLPVCPGDPRCKKVKRP